MSRTDVVVNGIREMILRGELAPGDRLPPENDLAAILGVSRGSLREGISALSMMGVVDVRQGAGTFVSSLDSRLLLGPIEFLVELHAGDVACDLHAVRRVLEGEAAGLAAVRITASQLAELETILTRMDSLFINNQFSDEDGQDLDRAFHRVIARASGNRILATLIEALSTQSALAQLWHTVTRDGVAQNVHHQHRAVLEALRSGDPERARLTMATHLTHVEAFLDLRPHDVVQTPQTA